MIKILIIDDHPLVIDGIKTMLKDESYFHIEAAAKTAKDALTFLDGPNAVDVILLDINLPDTDGLKLCELIRAKNKTVKILGLTYVNEAGIITQLIRKGANGYLLKNMEREELISAINQVMDGIVYLSKAANDKIVQQLQSYELNRNSMPVLTRREKEILVLLSEGLTSNEIAAKLFLSNYTVDTHRKNMLQKFNVHNTTALLNVVKELRLVE
jgi:two-component system, NarL family, nitrate/nitrite response regulator NarL